MTRTVTAILGALFAMLVGASGPSWAQQAQPFLLAPANGIQSATHLILTVPLTERDEVERLGAVIADRFGVTLTAEWPLKSIAVHCFVMDAGNRSDMEGLIARMREDDQIRTVQRKQNFGTFAHQYSDPLFPIQSALTQLNALAAQNFSMGTGVKIAVIDSAIDGAHPDLSGRLSEPRDFVGDGKDDMAEDHGTSIAGIIAADAANAIGIVGIAPAAQMTGLRACWQAPSEAGRCNSFSLARALNFAILNDFDIINMSLGGPSDPLLEELVEDAMKKNIVVVAAWGEESEAAFPASVPGIIAAGGSSQSSIPAPSVDVISTAPHNEYRYVSGSSVAAAHVTGVTALLLSMKPDMDMDEVSHSLHSAVQLRDGKPMLDACQALYPDGEKAASCSPD